uniref:Uncharacterized protein n=1 Tax=Meloidogyne hapla TaxID=6305 RepID=A0A1I8AYJ6_MELHA
MDETNKLEELNKQLIEVMRDQINNITKEKEITEQILDINKSLNPNNFSLNKNKHVNLQENSKNKDQQNIQENKNIKEQLNDLIISNNDCEMKSLKFRKKIQECLIKKIENKTLKKSDKKLIEIMSDEVKNIEKQNERTDQILKNYLTLKGNDDKKQELPEGIDRII